MSFIVLAMRPMKEGTKMLMSNECGDNAIVESLLLSMLLSHILSTESCLCFPPSLESAQ